MALSSSAVANAKPGTKPYRLSDERALFLLVQPDGSRWWRFTYRRPNTSKRNTLSLGIFPDVSLRQARERRDDLRKLLAEGIDPGEKRKAELLTGADTFEAVAREWFAKYSPQWAQSHGQKIIRRFERDIFPWIGSKPVAKLAAPEVLSALRRIEARGAIETAHRAHQNCGQVLRYAVATGRAQGDVTRDLRGALTPWKPEHYPSLTEPARLGELLRAIEGFSGNFPTRCALQLAALTFVRPGELRMAEWNEFDWNNAEWNIPATRMKLRIPHLVPMAKQAIAILRELYALTGSGRYVFPGARDRRKPMSNMAINAALRRMGFDKDSMTAHGFRATARTILDEVLGFRPDYIEHQLAHAVRDPNGRAYNRTAHLTERRKMMQMWADYLDGLTCQREAATDKAQKA